MLAPKQGPLGSATMVRNDREIKKRVAFMMCPEHDSARDQRQAPLTLASPGYSRALYRRLTQSMPARPQLGTQKVSRALSVRRLELEPWLPRRGRRAGLSQGQFGGVWP